MPVETSLIQRRTLFLEAAVEILDSEMRGVEEIERTGCITGSGYNPSLFISYTVLLSEPISSSRTRMSLRSHSGSPKHWHFCDIAVSALLIWFLTLSKEINLSMHPIELSSAKNAKKN